MKNLKTKLIKKTKKITIQRLKTKINVKINF
jgi:ubiquitin